MEKSLVLAAVFVAAAGAASAGAIHFATSPYAGSDTEYLIQNDSILLSGLGNTGWTFSSATGDYAGGGSGAGENAMVAGTQQTAPMSRMMKGGAGKNVCASSTAITTLANASGVVIGIDAARIFASAAVINGNSACNANVGNPSSGIDPCTKEVAGLIYDNAGNPPNTAAISALGVTNWRDVLALLYGGLDRSSGVTDCTSSKRQSLISNWSFLFENAGCTNPNGTALTHAWRRDDNSGTSDVFSSLIGIQGASKDQFGNNIAGFSVSSSAIHAFGTTPYCNALNWDTTEASAGSCANSANLHYVGPGGVPLGSASDPNCGGAGGATPAGCHHIPPAGAYGTMPLGTQSRVYVTSYQDNDPIRTTCLGVGNPGRPGEDVCNNDGKLGVVLPIPPLDWVAPQNTGVLAYTAGPSAATTCQHASAGILCSAGTLHGQAPTIFVCAPRNNASTGAGSLCPNNDGVQGSGCQYPVGPASGGGSTAQCMASKSNLPTCVNPPNGAGTCGPDGRVFNSAIINDQGAFSGDGKMVYVQFTVGGTKVDMTGAYGRIHQRDVSVSGVPVCQVGDATQNIGCLAQADPLSVGFGGNTGDAWENNDPLGTGACANSTVGLDVHNYGAGVACTPASPSGGGAAVSYPLWRKLYFNSAIGFANVTNTAELNLGQWESVGTNIGGVMVDSHIGEFKLPFSPVTDGTGAPAPFCEDFNEYGAGCAPSTGTGNINGCGTNHVGGVPSGGALTSSFGTIPADPSTNAGNGTVNTGTGGVATTSTVCGNGIIEHYEDCDPGTPAAGAAAAIPAAALPSGCGTCSSTCRCSNF